MSWETIPLGDFLTLKRGYDLPAAQRKEGAVPVVSSSGITGNHNVAKVAAPGVVTGRYGTLGEVFYVDEDYWPLNTALYVRDFKGNDPRFTAYFLKGVLTGITGDKAAVPGVNRNDLHARMVRTTRDNALQRSIASILSAYDDLIENNRRRIQLLEQSARLLYKEWFVIRPYVEAFLRMKFPDRFPGGQMLGSFIKTIREAPSSDDLAALQPRLSELEDLNAFARKFPHDNPGQTTEGEVQSYIQKAFKFVRGEPPWREE